MIKGYVYLVQIYLFSIILRVSVRITKSVVDINIGYIPKDYIFLLLSKIKNNIFLFIIEILTTVVVVCTSHHEIYDYRSEISILVNNLIILTTTTTYYTIVSSSIITYVLQILMMNE